MSAVVRRPGPADVALLAAVLVAGSVQRHAVYTWYGLLILIAGVGLLFGAVLRGAAGSRPAPWSVAVAVLATAWFQLIKPPWMNVEGTVLLAVGAWTAGLATLGVLAVLAAPARWRWPAGLGVLAATAVSYLLVVRGSVRALIDVWVILQGASLGAAHGQNPYRMTFDGVPPGQVNDCFNYLPVTFLAPVPSRLLLGDVRYAGAAVLLVGVVALAWRARGAAPSRLTPPRVAPSLPAPSREAPSREAPSREAPSREAPSREAPSREAPSREAPSREAPSREALSRGALSRGALSRGALSRVALSRVALPLALLVGLLPGSLYEVQQAWNEAILVGALAGAALLADRGRPWWAVACVAVALATKQHVVLLLPLLAFWPAFGVRRAVVAAAGGGALCLPWYLWDPPRFTHCTVDFFLDLPARADSLSVWHLLPHGVGTPLLLVAAVASYAVALRSLPRDGAGLLLGWGLILAAWDLVNKQSFLNQWLLVAQLTLAALALSAAASPPRQAALPKLGRLTTSPRQIDHEPFGRLPTNPSAD